MQEIVIEALKEVYLSHQALGEKGKEVLQVKAPTHKSEFVQVLRADLEAEETVLNYLTKHGVPIRVVSEEHGVIDIVSRPRLLGTLDGIDGTKAYLWGGRRYGTMFNIFGNIHPNYRDYLAAGIIDYPSGRLAVASKGNGTFVLDGERVDKVQTSRAAVLDQDQTRIYIDGSFEVNKETFEARLRGFKKLFSHNPDNPASSAVCYFDLVTGDADFVLECTRKGNLELAVAYGLVMESGGVMVDLRGKDMGQQRYLEFGQGKGEYIPIISACNPILAAKLLEFLKTPLDKD